MRSVRIANPMIRLLLFVCLAACAGPALAEPVTIFSPFNLPGTIDTDVVKIGDNVAFADGERFKLDVDAPKTRRAPRRS